MASCFFYMFFKPIYILILFFTIIIDYFAGIFIEKQENVKKKKYYLIISLIANIGVLVVFKYYNFLAENVNSLFSFIHYNHQVPFLEILLPIGLSFHTFQAMSYTIEVYRGNQKPERHFGIYALYVMFYPQLVAGPIERPQNILHQFHEVKVFNYENFRSGLILMTWGMFKKVVIADRLAMFVNQVYQKPENYEGLPLIIGTSFFAFQIFCDFSGYSDIAIGSARCMGYELMTNFDRPYQATSIAGFWRKWHISLSTWFRDYVYFPLGGNRGSKLSWYRNTMTVFLISGLWHGANWTYVIWGFLHGIYIIIGSWFSFNIGSKSTGVAGIIVKRSLVFILVGFAWIFFRAVSLSDALHIVFHLVRNLPAQLVAVVNNSNFERLDLLYLGQGSFEFGVAILSIALLSIIHSMQKGHSFDQFLLSRSGFSRNFAYYMLALGIVYLGVFNKSEFIYFQF